jgi:hypothetical protein
MIFYKAPLLIWNNGMVEKWNMGYEKSLLFHLTAYSNIPLFQYPVVFDYSKPADLKHCSENKFIDFKMIIPAMSICLKPIKKLAVHFRLNFSQPE